jgi:hypothetical protein
MQPHQYFLSRQMQTALYALKRQYGGPIAIYRLLTSEVDSRTGEAVVRTRVTRVRRVTVLPAMMTRDVVRNISIISADKQMVQGGSYDASKRVFIIDRRDARSLVLSQDDWLVWDGVKYQFEKIEELEFRTGWIITGKALFGETDLETGVQQSLEASDVLTVDDVAAGEVV